MTAHPLKPSSEALLRHLRAAEAAPLFVTGAGISVASGVPTFRGDDPGAVWSQRVTEEGTHRFFLRHPDKSWRMYLERFDGLRAATPNAAHLALTRILKLQPAARLITQNVDGLHSDSGARDVIEIHGSARKMRCTNRHCKLGPPRGFIDWDEGALSAFRARPHRETVPRCPRCRKRLRPHILWFDEGYGGHADYRFKEALRWSAAATVVVFIGTSLSVGITDMILSEASTRGAPVFCVDPHLQRAPGMEAVTFIREAAEEILPALVERIARPGSLNDAEVVF